MTDRLEELLALMDDGAEEEREDETAPAGQLPVLPPERSREARDAGEIPGEEFAPEDAADGEARGGPNASPVWEAARPARVRGAPGLEASGQPEREPETAVRPGEADRAGAAELEGTVRRGDERGLEGLYRRAAQAVRPAAAQILPVERAGRTFRGEEPGRTAALTVEELDRAVRRDSRRYDGGMTIF